METGFPVAVDIVAVEGAARTCGKLKESRGWLESEDMEAETIGSSFMRLFQKGVAGMGWFTGDSTMEKKSALRNAVAVMLADGKIEDNELTMLGLVCKRLGLQPAVLKEIMENPQAVEFVVPQSNAEKAAQLVDVIFMMMIDGDIDQKEFALCQGMAVSFGLDPAIVGKVITDVAATIKNNQDRGQAISALQQVLQ